MGILIKLVIFPLAPAVTTAGNLAKTRIKLQVSGKMYFGQLVQLVAAVGSVACVVYQRETDLAAGQTVIAHHQHRHNRVDYPTTLSVSLPYLSFVIHLSARQRQQVSS